MDPKLGPQLNHRISDDGLTLVSTGELRAGTWTSTLHWPDRETARANYMRAIFENERLARERGDEMRVGQGVWLRRFRWGSVFTSTGPPTWWKPRCPEWERCGDHVLLRCGWLRLAVIVRVDRP